MNRRYRDAEFLREQYVDRRKSASEIADLCDVASSTVQRWLDRHGIERNPCYQDREWLREQYVDRRRDQRDIAEDCGVAESTICHWLARHGITDGESLRSANCVTCGDEFRYYPSVHDGRYCSNECANAPRRRQVEITCPNCEETFERRQSLDTEYCSMACWGADKTPDRSGFYSTHWLKQREKALERDNYQCTVCGISDDEHRRRFGRGIEVHHTVPVRLFKQWDKPPEHAHVLRNLTTLCRTHHPDAPGTTVEPSDNGSDSV
ncbi:HNH endonuclease signature motif containing protein [Halomicrobium salinisoli]|uniref:HNH endonuclease signature motif containing protein n=1 Tax=Halomicrobium salinisoli TaxID=2878391 RepID=UPI001CF08C90|nr:HNH endonuclease signature motif containing protein [Halomicrobium salinisoli]